MLFSLKLVIPFFDMITHPPPLAVTDTSVKIGWWSGSLSDNSLRRVWMIMGWISFLLISDSGRSVSTVFGNQGGNFDLVLVINVGSE